jgi:hypothetical protein
MENDIVTQKTMVEDHTTPLIGTSRCRVRERLKPRGMKSMRLAAGSRMARCVQQREYPPKFNPSKCRPISSHRWGGSNRKGYNVAIRTIATPATRSTNDRAAAYLSDPDGVVRGLIRIAK